MDPFIASSVQAAMKRLRPCLSLALLAAAPSAFAQPDEAGKQWDFEFTPYFWATAVRADANTQLLGTQRFDVPFSDLASALDFGAMGTLEARKGAWGAILDAQYVKLSEQRTPAAIPARVDMKYSQQIWTVVATYRVLDQGLQLDLLGGARYLRVGTDLTLSSAASPATLGRTFTRAWWDAVIGARALYPLNASWALMGYADVGHGGSDPSWQLVAGANYRVTDSATVKFGYRAIGFDRGITDARLRGPYLGIGFRF